MDPFLRLLQITLITTKIYQSQTSQSIPSSKSLSTSVTSSSTLNSSLVDSSSTPKSSSVSSGSTRSSSVDSSSTHSGTLTSTLNQSSFLSSSQGTNVQTSAAGTIGSTTSVQPPTSSNQPPMSTTSGGEKPIESLPGKTSQSRSTTQPDLSTVTSPRITANITPSQTLSISFKKSTTTGVVTTSTVMQASSVFAQSTKTASQESQKTVVTSKSSESSQPPSASQMNSVTDRHTSTVAKSTKAPSASQSGFFSRQTHYMTVNYSSSSASLQSSIDVTTVPTTTAASFTVQSLTPSPVSLNWTDWSVGEEDCQKYCSEKGGTVTASRQCYSHSVTLDDSICTNHNVNISTTKVVNCDEPYCPISGTEALRSSIVTVLVGISPILLTKFIGD